MADKFADHFIGAQFFQFYRTWSLGAISLRVDDAKEAKSFAFRCSKLMPSERRDLDKVVHADFRNFVSDENLSVALDDHHDVRMQMSFKR